MVTYALLLVLIVLIIGLIAYVRPAWIHLNFWRAHLVEPPDQVYARSAGRFDDAAAIALQRSEAPARPLPADHLRAARIIEQNILSQEHRPILTGAGYTRADRDLSLRRLEMWERARDHHLASLTTLTTHDIWADETDRAERRIGATPQMGEDLAAPGADVFITAALEFTHNAFETLMLNDIILTIALANDDRILPDMELLDLAGRRQQDSVEARQSAAAQISEEQGGGNGARADIFLDLSKRNTSDGQNSHDPSVNAAKRAMVVRLRTSAKIDDLPSLEQISKEIRNESNEFTRDPRTGRPRPALAGKALGVVKRAGRGDRSISADATDAEVLRRVWGRADDSRNTCKENRRTQMRQATFDALVDCWEPGLSGDRIQCVDGIISRLLGSLTLLDYDEKNWEMRRLEHHKNDIYAKAAEVIRLSAVEATEQINDPELQKVGWSYLAETPETVDCIGDVDDKKEAEWIASTRSKIEQMVDDYAAEAEKNAPGTISRHAAEKLKKEATAAI